MGGVGTTTGRDTMFLCQPWDLELVAHLYAHG